MGAVLNKIVKKLKERNVCVIVGAGASNYERFGVPILREKLLEILKLRAGGHDSLQTNTIYHLNKMPSDCSLEELLSVYSNIYNGSIDLFLTEQGIKPKSKIKEIPPICYEVIAHFICHRLVKYVISFNFDEYLEVSLDDEIGEDGYEWVRSKSIFQKLAEEGDLRKPLLIKPHGTISYPATIRPTFETVQQFEEEKQELLERVLKGTSAWLIVGFSCPDPDFQKVLKKIIMEEKNKEVFWIDKNERFPQENPLFNFIKGKIQPERCEFINDEADKFFLKLANCIHRTHRGYYPAIARHKFRSYFAHCVSNLNSIEDLLKLETIAYAIKARGMFSLEGVLKCKSVNNFCLKIRRENINIDIKKIFEDLVNRKILRKNNKIKSAEVYYIPNLPSNPMAKRILECFSHKTKTSKKGKISHKRNIKNVEKIIQEMMQNFDLTFGEEDNYLYLKFHKPQLIKNYKELYERTIETVSSAKKKLNIITETGEWILRSEFKKLFADAKRKNLKINLILAQLGPKDDFHSRVQKDKHEGLKKFFGGILKMKYLPWDRHNVHMTINEKGEGVYFLRTYKSPIFTPVFISDEKDSKTVKNEFNSFYSMAKNYSMAKKMKMGKIFEAEKKK